MLFQAIFGKRMAWLLPLIAYSIVLAGCIAEPPTPMQVVPEVIVPPAGISFSAPLSGYIKYSTPPTGTMFVHWSQSVADTQLNFKGYFVKLYTADTNGMYLCQCYDTERLVDTITIFRPYTAPGVPVKFTDTSYTFTSLIGSSANSGIPLGTYEVYVKGLKTGTPTFSSTPDSAFYVGLFDPRPLESPTNLRATSVGATTVLLRWTAPVTDKDTGLFQYVVYYRDTSLHPFDTGHVAAIIPILHPNIVNDSVVLVSVPAHNASGSSTSEWPYEFWVKAERNDSTFFYGADIYGPDTNEVVWSGAEACPKNYPGVDSAGTGDSIPPWGGFHNSLYFGSNNGQWDMVDDSNASSMNYGSEQVVLNIDTTSKTVTLTTASGAMFLGPSANNATYDTTPSLDSLFYTYPFVTPSSTFAATSFTLPNPPRSTGIVLYLRMIDPTAGLNEAPEYARLFIQRQSNGTF